ncbi:putative nuclease [Nymphaea thermarum]|nr:putative nuclease [Nymphaea thermarum]
MDDIDMFYDDEELECYLIRIGFVFIFFWLRQLPHTRRIVHPFRDVGSSFVQLMLEGHPRNCMDLLRMDRHTYMTLCTTLRTRNLLEDAREISLEEQVAIFLLTIGRNGHNRATQNTLQHSGQTISKYVSLVLRALCILGRDFIRRRPNIELPSSIRRSERFFPYFQDCLGAIDGTHVPAWVTTSDQARFCNRKGVISQNVMAIVGFDTRFQYVLAGWEGSATDSRVLYNALDHPTDSFVVPEGKYYLADGGYPNIVGLLTPYRGHRYHMSEFSAPGPRTPRTQEELFNHRHSSLQNVVERTFGMLKGRFPILKCKFTIH